MISDATIREAQALMQARHDEYVADRAREETTAALAHQIRQCSPCDEWQARNLAEHLIDIGWTLPAQAETDHDG